MTNRSPVNSGVDRAPSMLVRLDLGCPVHCSDGDFGELADVVIDPTTRRVTHLVVQPHDGAAKAVLVPVERSALGRLPECGDHAGRHDRRDRPAGGGARVGVPPARRVPGRGPGLGPRDPEGARDAVLPGPRRRQRRHRRVRRAHHADLRPRPEGGGRAAARQARCAPPTGITSGTSMASSSTTRSTSPTWCSSAVISGASGRSRSRSGPSPRSRPTRRCLSLTKDQVGAMNAVRVHRWHN